MTEETAGRIRRAFKAVCGDLFDARPLAKVAGLTAMRSVAADRKADALTDEDLAKALDMLSEEQDAQTVALLERMDKLGMRLRDGIEAGEQGEPTMGERLAKAATDRFADAQVRDLATRRAQLVDRLQAECGRVEALAKAAGHADTAAAAGAARAAAPNLWDVLRESYAHPIALPHRPYVDRRDEYRANRDLAVLRGDHGGAAMWQRQLDMEEVRAATRAPRVSA